MVDECEHIYVHCMSDQAEHNVFGLSTIVRETGKCVKCGHQKVTKARCLYMDKEVPIDTDDFYLIDQAIRDAQREKDKEHYAKVFNDLYKNDKHGCLEPKHLWRNKHDNR